MTTPCSKCGEKKHYVLTKRKANRFGITGKVVAAVKCSSCGKKTKV